LAGGEDTLDLTGRASGERVVANGGDGTDTVLLDVAYSAVAKISAITDGVAITHGNTTDEFRFFESFVFNAGPTLTLGNLLNAPALANTSTLGYTENGSAAAINALITVADPANATLASATVSITGNFASGQDVLSFSNVPATMGNISGSYDSGTGVLTLTSAGVTATLAQWQAALRAVAYSNSSDNPSTAARTISYQVNDGQGANPGSNTITSTVNVTAVNDAPVINGSPIVLSTTEGVSGALSGQVTATDPDQGDTQTWTVVGGTTPQAASYAFAMNEFKVVRSNTTFFDDTFSDGNPPPAVPGGTLTYTTPVGSFTESGGLLILDSALAASTFGFGTATPFVANIETLATNTDSGDISLGLKKNFDFTVSGLFNLAFPDDLREEYGIRLQDSLLGVPGSDMLELVVRKGANGAVQVQFRDIDPAANTSPTTLAAFTLPSSFDNGSNQIAMRLMHVADSTAITASFDILDASNNILQTVTFGTTGSIFTDGNLWTRAQIIAAAPETTDSYLVGTYGVLSVDKLGNWNYAVRNGSVAVEALAAGQVVQDTFTLKVTDTAGAFDTKTVTVNVTGVNDAPVQTLPGSTASTN
jgi:VCBS repeat-containing protein